MTGSPGVNCPAAMLKGAWSAVFFWGGVSCYLIQLPTQTFQLIKEHIPVMLLCSFWLQQPIQIITSKKYMPNLNFQLCLIVVQLFQKCKRDSSPLITFLSFQTRTWPLVVTIGHIGIFSLFQLTISLKQKVWYRHWYCCILRVNHAISPKCKKKK